MSGNSLFELTNNDFNNDTTLRKYKKSIVIILFYMTGCHWCDLCKPDFIKAATSGMSKVRFSMIDISKPDGQALKEKLNSVQNPKFIVKGVPKIVGYKNGEFYAVYAKGGPDFRKTNDFLAFAQGIKKDVPVEVDVVAAS